MRYCHSILMGQNIKATCRYNQPLDHLDSCSNSIPVPIVVGISVKLVVSNHAKKNSNSLSIFSAYKIIQCMNDQAILEVIVINAQSFISL